MHIALDAHAVVTIVHVVRVLHDMRMMRVKVITHTWRGCTMHVRHVACEARCMHEIHNAGDAQVHMVCTLQMMLMHTMHTWHMMHMVHGVDFCTRSAVCVWHAICALYMIHVLVTAYEGTWCTMYA